MKKTMLPSNRLKNFVAWFACITYLLIPRTINAQSTCATATATPTHGGCVNNASTTYTDTWYSLVADSTVIQIDVYKDDPSPTGISSLSLYSGTCSSLTLVSPTGTPLTGEYLSYTYTGLTRGATYYVKLSKGNTTSTTYGICVSDLSATTVSCSGCPNNPNNNANNTCQAVCNGGFEYYSSLIGGISQINNICPWTSTGQYDTQGGTPDAFNTTVNTAAASTGWRCKVPNNFAGYQTPHHGNGYAGVITYNNTYSSLREYAVQPLLVPLQSGKKYTVSFWVNLGGRAGYATSGMGAWLSTSNPNSLGEAGIQIQTPQIKGSLYNTVITDTTNWVLVTDTFTVPVGSTYNYIAIGCFKSDATNGHTAVSHTSSTGWGAGNSANLGYYYIDDVSIVPYGSISVSVSPNPVCNGYPVTLVATTTAGIGNGYYTWGTNPTTSMTYLHSPFNDTAISVPAQTSSTMYTVTTTVPGFANCTISDSIKPSWLAGPINVNAGADQSICYGGSAILTGTASGQYNLYSWSKVGTGIVCGTCMTTTVTPTSTAQYVFTCTNSSTGCSRTDTVKITVTPITVSIVSQAGANTCGGCYNFTTAASYSMYSWSSNAASSSGSTTSTFNACYNSAWNTTHSSGTISVTVTDAQGCIGTSTVTVPYCCENIKDTMHTTIFNDSTSHLGITRPNYFHWNATAGYYEVNNLYFAVNGILTINKNTRFIGCDVKLGPNAKIVVSPGIKFEMTNLNSTTFTRLYACTDMWDGIYVDGADTASRVAVLNGTSIEDAKNAIVSTNGGNFVINGTNFTCKLNKNNIGVLIKPFQGVHRGIIRKTIIACDAPGQPGSTSYTYSGTNCRAPVNGKAFCAIYVDSCSNVTIGDSTSNSYRNTFERQKYGIYSKNSNVKTWNNNLKYYQASGPQKKNSPIEGIAVYAVGNPVLTRTLTVGRVGNYKAHNMILKSDYGVMVENSMNLNCEYNRIDSAKVMGVYALNCQYGRTILVNKDSITEFSGTGVNCTNIKQSTVTVTNNILNESFNLSPNSFAFTGIYVGNAVNYTTCTVTIQSNTIKKIRNGIWILNVTRAQLLDNNISFYVGQPMTTAMPAIGIKMEAAHSSLVRNNQVVYNNTAYTTGSQLAAFYDKLIGISVTMCYNDTVTKNVLNRCGSGMFLKGTEIPFLNGCNKFQICYYGVNFGYSNATQTSVHTSDQIRWGNPYSGTATPTGDTWTSCNNDIKGKVSPSINWYCNSTNVPSVNLSLGSFSNSNLPTTIGTSDQCSALLGPITPLSATEMRNALLSGICKVQRTYDTLGGQYTYWDSLFAFRTLRQNPSWLSLGNADDTYYSNWYTAVGSTNLGKLANVEDSISSKKITGATTLLNSITPHSTQEANRKTVLGIYLSTWAKDSMNLDSMQIVTLTTIANAAPITGGSAVYDARAMLFLEVHDSSALRLAPELSYFVNGEVLPGHIYPNPSTGQLNLAYELPEGQTGEMQLYDLSGRIVHKYPLQGGTPIQQFDASDVPNGLYFYMVTLNGEMLLSEKVIILRKE